MAIFAATSGALLWAHVETGRPRRLMIYSHFPEAAGIGFDVRNGRRRFLESPFEWEYAARLLRGEAPAPFRAPSF